MLKSEQDPVSQRMDTLEAERDQAIKERDSARRERDECRQLFRKVLAAGYPWVFDGTGGTKQYCDIGWADRVGY